ncbi:MAG: hypothetical protein AAF943_04910 [Pseudomonadota bacterium]
MTTIEIPPHEFGVTRVFSLSMTSREAQAVKNDPHLRAKALGAAPRSESSVEVFAIADLGDLGLAGYLRDGVDAAPEDIAKDRARLAALEGWVLIVHSSAFSPEGATLTLMAEMTPIGTYRQVDAARSAERVTAETAKPYSGHAAPLAPPERAQVRSSASWILLALALAFAGLGLWAFL